MIGYDKISEHKNILLDLPFYEGMGLVTRDQAKPHHQDVDLKNVPVWDRTQFGDGAFGRGFTDGFDQSDIGAFNLAFNNGFHSGEGLGVINFVRGDDHYLELDNLASADLNFTTGDFSIGCWINWDSTGGFSQIIIGRYEVLVSGWEIYLDISSGRNTVSQRHSHGSIVGNTNSNCFSTGWTPGTWALLGISRIRGNLYPVHYRNGIALVMEYEVSGMLDPDTCNRDLAIGTRFTKDANWYQGQKWRPRLWNRPLSEQEWLNIFERERKFFEV